MPQNHYKAVARSPDELLVRGKYFEVAIEKIVLDAEVVNGFPEAVGHFVLFEVVYSNFWEYVISTNSLGALLIDSNGFQHSECSLYNPVIHKAKGLKKGTELQSIAYEVQGQARSAGFLVFPELKKSAVPHRLIFQFQIFEPGQTSGYVQDSEKLELIFDLSLYGRLIGESKK